MDGFVSLAGDCAPRPLHLAARLSLRLAAQRQRLLGSRSEHARAAPQCNKKNTARETRERSKHGRAVGRVIVYCPSLYTRMRRLPSLFPPTSRGRRRLVRATRGAPKRGATRGASVREDQEHCAAHAGLQHCDFTRRFVSTVSSSLSSTLIVDLVGCLASRCLRLVSLDRVSSHGCSLLRLCCCCCLAARCRAVALCAASARS